jgi:hypothetical protein
MNINWGLIDDVHVEAVETLLHRHPYHFAIMAAKVRLRSRRNCLRDNLMSGGFEKRSRKCDDELIAAPQDWPREQSPKGTRR